MFGYIHQRPHDQAVAATYEAISLSKDRVLHATSQHPQNDHISAMPRNLKSILMPRVFPEGRRTSSRPHRLSFPTCSSDPVPSPKHCDPLTIQTRSCGMKDLLWGKKGEESAENIINTWRAYMHLELQRVYLHHCSKPTMSMEATPPTSSYGKFDVPDPRKRPCQDPNLPCGAITLIFFDRTRHTIAEYKGSIT